MILLYSIDSIF